MSSFFNEAFDTMLNNYINEVVALGLFSVGYYLFRQVNRKYPANEKQDKQNVKIPLTPSIEEGEDHTILLQRYNIYIRDNLIHSPDLNPFQVLHQMQLENISPDITTYNTLLDICFTQKNFEIGEKLFASMKDELSPVSPDLITYNILLKGISLNVDLEGKKTHITRTYEIFDLLKQDNLQPNHITYNTIIDIHIKCGKINRAFEFVEEMEKSKIKPDIYTYSTLIKGIKNLEENNLIYPEPVNLDKIFSILKDIKEKKILKVDEILYNCVLDACFKFRNFNKAMEVFNEMQNNGIEPTLITYGILIKGYGQYRNFEKVLQSYYAMKKSHIKANDVTFGCLIHACIRCGKLEKALELLDEEKDVKINTIIYTTLLKGFSKEKNLKKAMEVVEKMNANEDTKPNIITYNSLLDCAVACNAFETIEEIFKVLIPKSKLTPDLITYSTYIKGLCKSKRPVEAYAMFLELRSNHKFEIDEVLYNSVLDGLVKLEENKKALDIYCMMKEDKIPQSNVTYSILIKLFSHLQKFDDCINLVKEMKKKSVRPGLIVYTCLIQSCIKHKKADLLMDIYQEMIVNGIKGDIVFYNTLISGLAFNHQLKSAVEILNKTIDMHMVLNPQIYINILRNLCKKAENPPKVIFPNTLHGQQITEAILNISHFLRTKDIEIEDDLYKKITKNLCKSAIEGEMKPSFFTRAKKSRISNY